MSFHSHLSPLPAGQSISIQDSPQHPSSDGGIDPQQPEAVVVVLDLIHNSLLDRPPNGF